MTVKWPDPGLVYLYVGSLVWLSGLVDRAEINLYLTFLTALVRRVNL